MVDAPEKIWIEQDNCPYFYEESELAEAGSPVTEYVRADKLEELKAENERLRGDCRAYEKTMQAIAETENTALAEAKRENEALREALEPFALEYEKRARLAPGPDIDHWPIGGSALTYRHIRIAYEASRNAGGNNG